MDGMESNGPCSVSHSARSDEPTDEASGNPGSSASHGGVLTIKLSTPSSTKGTISIPACNGVVAKSGISVDGKVAGTSSSAIEMQGGERSIKIKFDSIVPI